MLPEFNGQIIGKYNQPESCVLIGQQFSPICQSLY